MWWHPHLYFQPAHNPTPPKLYFLWDPAGSQQDFLQSQRIQHTKDCILDCFTKLAPSTFSSFSILPGDHVKSLRTTFLLKLWYKLPQQVLPLKRTQKLPTPHTQSASLLASATWPLYLLLPLPRAQLLLLFLCLSALYSDAASSGHPIFFCFASPTSRSPSYSPSALFCLSLNFYALLPLPLLMRSLST